MPLIAKRLQSIVESPPFVNGVMILIILNAVLIGLETYPSVFAKYGFLLQTLDRIILWTFVLEISLRWMAWTPMRRFLLDGWNLFDFIIIVAGLLPASPYLSIMRIFRVLRVLRAVRVMPSMQQLVVTLLKSIPSLGHILFLMLILFYVYGVIGTFLFRETAPDYFGSLHRSFLTLFQIATLENWPDILSVLSPGMRGAWIYMVSFILLGTFVVLNLVVGVIVNNLQAAAGVESKGEGISHERDLAEIKHSLARIESEMMRLGRDR
jgi:voltage-gated sodium channel